MPHLNLQFTQHGPVLDILIGVSESRADALKRAAQLVPNRISIRALIDTGASCTCIDPTILSQLNLTATGAIPVHTPSTGGTPVLQNQFDVSLSLVHPYRSLTIPNIAVIESNLIIQGIDALIGRDVLKRCLFVYDGQEKHFTLAF